jgi:hypothetical protein
VAAFLPVIALFFLAMGGVEDSGRLSRAAYLMDAFMERLGLDGRSFVLSLMGFGCNVPAILGQPGDARPRPAAAVDAGDSLLTLLGTPERVPVHGGGLLPSAPGGPGDP